MGNVQCGAPAYDEDLDEALETKIISKQSSSPMCFVRPKSSTSGKHHDSFLTVHLEDPALKCILEPKEVNKALIEQAEQLIRREKLEKDDDLVSLLDEEDDEDDIASRNGGSVLGGASVAASEFTFAATEITTGTAATRPAGNYDKYSSKPKSRQKQNQNQSRPPQMKGKQFKLIEKFNDEVKHVLNTATNGGRPLATARQRLKAMESSNSSFPTQQDSGCGILVAPCMCIQDLTQPNYAEKAKGYMSALHLEMRPQCPQFYQNHMSILDLENPIIQAGSYEIPISVANVTPPRKSRQGASGLGGTSQRSSFVDGIEFGEGPPSSPIRLMVTDSPFMDLSVTGSLGLVERPRSRPQMSSPPRKQLKSPAHYIVLLNRRSGIPLAVCALKAASTGPPVVRIYTTKQRVFGQRPAASTRKLGLDWSESLPLYTWAEIVTEGRHPDKVKYSIFMASGSDGRFEDTPSYRAAHDASGSPVIRMVGRTERDTYHSGCAVISLSQDEDATEDDGVFFHLSIARGIDPALIICFAAFLDEVVEKSMRLRD
jgi:hypothetical protein